MESMTNFMWPKRILLLVHSIFLVACTSSAYAYDDTEYIGDFLLKSYSIQDLKAPEKPITNEAECIEKVKMIRAAEVVGGGLTLGSFISGGAFATSKFMGKVDEARLKMRDAEMSLLKDRKLAQQRLAAVTETRASGGGSTSLERKNVIREPDIRAESENPPSLTKFSDKELMDRKQKLIQRLEKIDSELVPMRSDQVYAITREEYDLLKKGKYKDLVTPTSVKIPMPDGSFNFKPLRTFYTDMSEMEDKRKVLTKMLNNTDAVLLSREHDFAFATRALETAADTKVAANSALEKLGSLKVTKFKAGVGLVFGLLSIPAIVEIKRDLDETRATNPRASMRAILFSSPEALCKKPTNADEKLKSDEVRKKISEVADKVQAAEIVAKGFSLTALKHVTGGLLPLQPSGKPQQGGSPGKN